MDFILDFIFDLVIENSIKIANNKKLKKGIRYPLAFLLLSFIIIVIGALFYAGIIFILDKEISTKIFGGLFIILDIVLVVSIIKRFKKKSNVTNKENIDK